MNMLLDVIKNVSIHLKFHFLLYTGVFIFIYEYVET